MIEIYMDIETTGLNPWLDHQVTCICAESNEGDIFDEVSDDEKQLLSNFIIWISKYSCEETLLVLANGVDFDMPFLCARMSKYFVQNLVWKMTKFKQFDLCTDTIKGEWGKISLNKLALLYGIQTKLAKGTDAIRWFKEKNFSQILIYCKDDVRITKEVYLKYLEMKK